MSEEVRQIAKISLKCRNLFLVSSIEK